MSGDQHKTKQELMGLVHDLSEPTAAEAALNESERKWRDILVNAPQISVTLDRQGQITFANNYLLRLTGWNREEVLGQDWFELFIPKNIRAEIREVFNALMARKPDQGIVTYENEILTRCGERRNVSWANVLTLNDQGYPLELTGLGVDLTEHRQAVALRESEAKFRHVFEHVGEGIFLGQADSIIREANPAAAAILGYDSPQQMVGLNAREHVHPDDLTKDGLPPDTLAFQQQGVAHLERRYRHVKGHFVPVLVTITRNQETGQHYVVFKDITERKRSEEALKRSEQRLKEAQRVGGLGDWDWEVHSGIITWSENLYGILGLDPSQPPPGLQGQLALYNPEDAEKLHQAVMRTLEDGTPYNLALRRPHPDGRERHLQAKGLADRNADGQVIRLHGSILDVTELKQAEQSLRQSEVKYRTLFENIQEAIFITDAQGRFLNVNQAACDLTGYRREEFCALAPSDLAPQGFGPQATGECTLFRKNGVRVIAEYSALANYLPDRHVLILRDISQRKRIEAARKENEARFVRAFHNSGVGMALVSPGGHFLEVNDKACQLYGYSRQELLARTFKDITYPEDLKSSKALYQHYLNGDQDSYELEKRYLRKDGEIRWGLVTVSKVRDADGQFLYSVAQTLDLTAIKQVQAQLIVAKEQAEAASRAKSEFLANMSHELRTPLNGVQGFLQLLEMSELEPEQAECVDLAMQSSQLLLRVINDILDFSKLEANRMGLLEEPFALAAQLEPVMAALAHQAAAKGIALHARIAPTIPTILIGDPARLRQVLFNLVGNAVKFTEHGEVIVEADVLEQIDAEHVRLRCSIRDTGIGVAENMIDFLFEPFTQADGSPTRRFQGTGLGLSIVKRLVGLMGGQVEMDSTLGEGTHVQFTIMVGTESAEETAMNELGATDLKVAEPPTKALRILVAEDEPTNAKVVQKLLEKLGHQVQIASNGRKALVLLGSQMFDLVLMDVQMPEMDGVEATRQIRENTTGDLNQSIPIIALTARALAGDREKYLAAGMNDYLSKPIDIQALNEALDQVVAAAS